MMKRIIDIIPSMATGDGIFSNITDPVWSDLFTGTTLDIYYAANYGDKWASKFPEFFTDDSGVIETRLSDFANAIYELRKTEWEKLYNDLIVEYNPIENTDALESTTETKTGSNTSSGTGSVESSGTSNSTGTVTDDAESTNANNVFGVNSVSAVGHDTSNGTDNRTSESTGENTTSAESTTTNTASGSYTETFTREYRKHGNIGVMTNVQLLRDDTDFWKWSFIREVCEDISNIISLSCY